MEAFLAIICSLVLHPAHGTLQPALGVDQEIARCYDFVTRLQSRHDDGLAAHLRPHLNAAWFEDSTVMRQEYILLVTRIHDRFLWHQYLNSVVDLQLHIGKHLWLEV